MTDNDPRTAADRDGLRLHIVPLTLRAANAYVTERHRHHKASRGHKFSIGVADDEGTLRGVAIVGRPVARAYDDGTTAEVNRSCTDGTKNANSALYGAAWRAARAMGYRRLITYTQPELAQVTFWLLGLVGEVWITTGESGASLRAAGYRVVAQREARGSWAESSVALRDSRDPDGSGGVARTLWEVA